MARGCTSGGGIDVLRRTRHIPKVVLRIAKPRQDRRTGGGARTQNPTKVRAALEASGLDHGPISVHEKMRAMGLEQVPPTASLARIFRAAGVARLEPKKKPRSAWRRFVYPAPNACWQLDAPEYVLSGGRTCVIFQLNDDHSRFALASHVASKETAKDAITMVDKAIAAYGVPQVDAFDHIYNTQRDRKSVV